jgi:hypothetical protein
MKNNHRPILVLFLITVSISCNIFTITIKQAPDTTITQQATNIATVTPQPTNTATAIPQMTNTAIATPQPTNTATATQQATNTATATPQLTNTATATGQAVAGSTFIDQSSIAKNTLAAYINECCKYIAQTFTAGATGILSGITIDVYAIPNSPYRLHIEIRTVTGEGKPSAFILGAITLESGSAPITTLIALSQKIHIDAGVQYAIVVSYMGAPPAGARQGQGIWLGSTGNTYPGGSAYSSISDGITWSEFENEDLHFQTYVTYDHP